MIVLPGKPSCGSVQNGTGFSTASGREYTVTSSSLKTAETIVNDTKDGISPCASLVSGEDNEVDLDEINLATFEDFSEDGGQGTIGKQEQSSALCATAPLCSVETVNPLPVSTLPVPKKAKFV